MSERRTIDYGGLDKAFETGVRVRPGMPDEALNETCPDWCVNILRHEVDYTCEPQAHESRHVFVRQSEFPGYGVPHTEDTFAAHLELALSRRLNSQVRIGILQAYGNDRREETERWLGGFTLDEARDLIAALTKLIEVAEHDEGLK